MLRLKRPASRIWLAAGLAAGLWPGVASAAEAPSAADAEFFERDVRPLLAAHCHSCHAASNAMSGLRLDSREAVLRGGARGPAAAPGDPLESLLVQAVRHESLRMPLGSKLAPAEIEVLEEWVRRGVPWPASPAPPPDADVSRFYAAMRRDHWAFQEVRRPDLPEADSGVSAEHPVDRFVVSKLRQASLEPSPPEGRAAWLRRLSFVLTGLPPSPTAVAAFAGDQSPLAHRKAIDRLLESPHFGEHWARHWMDVVRFGETLGNDWNYENNGAWLYRDYLIRAFNRDVPYDDLVREHIAGDLLPEPRLGTDPAVNESLIGTFFFRLGEQGHDDCTQFRAVRTDVVDDQIDTLGKAFLGLTIACARCHDHKLDPIPTNDYYGIYGVLDSSRLVTRTVDARGSARELEGRLRAIKARVRTDLGDVWEGEAAALGRYLRASLRDESATPAGGPSDQPIDPERVERIRKLVDAGDLGLEDPLFPWAHLVGRDAGPGSKPLSAAWVDLASRYGRHRRRRAEFNRENFEEVADFSRGDLRGWHAEGRAFEPVFSAAGAFSIAPVGDAVVADVLPAGVFTHVLSDRLNGALRSPYLPRDKRYLSLRVVGGKLAAWRTVLDNCMLSERYQLLDQGDFGWIKIPLREEHDAYRLYVELVTKHDNPRLPDRPDRMQGVDLEQMAEPRSYFGVTRAVLHDCDELPEDELQHLSRLFDAGPPADLEALADRYAAAARRAAAAWRAGQADADDVRWLRWLLDNRLLANSKYLTPALRETVDRYRVLERRLGAPRVIQGLADLDAGRDAPVFRAGNPEDPGEPVPRGFLSLLEHLAPAERSPRSGRLDLAETLVHPSNPLTARVMVNRIWHHLFGRGLVSTVDNLGRFGDRPTHPELLDYLADRFVAEGWSVKNMIRHIALSRTFRQSSSARPDAAELDPENRLLHRFPARRLPAESIRDAILAVSGKLDLSLFGPSVHPYREKPKAYRKLYSGPLDGNGRRSIYLKVTRHEGAAFLEALDFPPPLVARGRRDVTNVPRQALALLNDPFVNQEAQVWARGLIKETSESVATRLRTMFLVALGRPPNASERERFRALTEELAALHGVETGSVLASLPVWQGVAHALFNLKEFSHIL